MKLNRRHKTPPPAPEPARGSGSATPIPTRADLEALDRAQKARIAELTTQVEELRQYIPPWLRDTEGQAHPDE